MTLGSLLYAGSSFPRLAAAASILCGLAVETAAQGRGQPRLIRDLNAVADGRRVDPAASPELFPITEPAYPDTPCVVAGSLFCLASDGSSGGRRLWRYTPGTDDAIHEEIVVKDASHPRLLRVAADGSRLYFVLTLKTGEQAVHVVSATGQAKALAFDPAPDDIEIDCATVTGGGVAVLARTTMPSGPQRHVLWLEGSGDRLVPAAETTTPPYSEAADLVAVTQASGQTFYAFSAKCTAGPPPRCLVVVAPGVSPAFRELGRPAGTMDVAPNPALLTPVGDELLFVELAAYGSGALDKLRRLAGPSTPTSDVIASAPTIRDLRAVPGDGTWRLLYRARNGLDTALWSYANAEGVGMARLGNGAAPTSIASIVATGGGAFVLGTGDDRITRLWSHDGSQNLLVEVNDFPFSTCAGSLVAWNDATQRFAFLALTTDAPPQPVIVWAANGTWSTEPIPDVCHGTMPQMLTRVGTALWFAAAHRDRATEPWHWMY